MKLIEGIAALAAFVGVFGLVVWSQGEVRAVYHTAALLDAPQTTASTDAELEPLVWDADAFLAYIEWAYDPLEMLFDPQRADGDREKDGRNKHHRRAHYGPSD